MPDQAGKHKDGGQAIFEVLAEKTSAALFLIQRGVIVYANPAAEQLASVPPGELVGKPVNSLVTDESQNGIQKKLVSQGEFDRVIQIISGRRYQISSKKVILSGKPARLVTAVELSPEPIFQTIGDAVVVYNQDGVVEEANAAAGSFYGFDPTGLRQREVIRRLKVRYPEGRRLPLRELPSTRALKGERVQGEQMWVTSSTGEERFISVFTAPIHSGDSPSRVIVVWHYITEQESLLEVNRRQRKLLETILDADPGGLAVLSGPDLHFVYANPAYQKMIPHAEQDMRGVTFDEVWSPSEGYKQKAILQRVFYTKKTEEVHRDERRYPDGSFRTFSLRAQHILWDGKPAVLDSLWETTALESARREAEQLASEARQSAEELDAVINSMTEAVLIFDGKGEITRANPAAMDFYGIDPTQTKRENLLDRIQAMTMEGKPIRLNASPVSRALRGESISGERLIFMDARGEQITALVSASPIRHLGQVAGVVMFWQDVTDREKLVSLLEAEQARLNAVIENAPEAILMVDENGQVVLANPGAEALFGKTLSIGEDIRRVSDAFYRLDGSPYRSSELPMLKAARNLVTFTNEEMLLIKAGGQRRLVACSAAPLLGRSGQASGAVVVFQDITQRKRAEELARREAARMELLASLSQAFAEAGLYYPAVLGTISRRATEAIGDACVIRLISDDGHWLDPVAFHHVDPEALAKYRNVLNASRKPVDDAIASQAMINGNPLVWLDLTAEDLKNIQRYSVDATSEVGAVQNALLVPLRAQGRFIGTFTVVRDQSENPFTLEDQAFVQDLADRAALAIDNARLYAAETTRSRELEALHRAATALLGNLDLDSLLDQVLETAREAIPSTEKGLLHLADPETGELKVRAMLGFRHPRVEKVSGGGNGYQFLNRAVHNKQPELVREVEPLVIEGKRQGPRSAIVAPLILGKRVLGALSLTSSRVNAFTESDLRLLVSLAATATAAIQNARLHTEVQRLAVTDELTGILNRRGFFDLGERELERFHRFGRPLSAIMLDIDHFKNVNDTYGHPAGDQVLATVARRSRAHVRQVDILGRYGGEEFAILLPETDIHTAIEIAERIRRSVSGEPVTTPQGSVVISVSLGVAQAAPGTEGLSDLLQETDLALYKAKQEGRNRVEVQLKKS